jgi:hypothetical protein
MRLALSTIILAVWKTTKSHAFQQTAPTFLPIRFAPRLFLSEETTNGNYDNNNNSNNNNNNNKNEDIFDKNSIEFENENENGIVMKNNNVMEELRNTVNTAKEQTEQSEERIIMFQQERDDTKRLLEQKQAEFTKQGDEWYLDKANLLVQVADFAKKLQTQEQQAAMEQDNITTKAKVRQGLLQREIDTLTTTLQEKELQLLGERESAEQLRTRLYNAEDQLEFEQMRFQKETKDLNIQIIGERTKLSDLEKDLNQEQQRFQQESFSLKQTIEETTSKLQQAEELLNENQARFELERAQMFNDMANQKQIVDSTISQVTLDSQRFSDERAELNKCITEGELKLQQAEETMKQKQQQFKEEQQNLEMKIIFEKARVEKLQKMLDSEEQRFKMETNFLETTLEEERTRLAIVETMLREDTKKFEKEVSYLQKEIKKGEKIRQEKASEMNARYNNIRDNLTQQLEGQKREARKDRSRLIEKYDLQINKVNMALNELNSDLELAKQQTSNFKAMMDDVVREKTKVLDDSHRMEKSYQKTISDRNADIAELRGTLLSVMTTVKERDEEIRLHESSYREILRLSFQLTRERLDKRTRATREHLGNKVRKIVNKLLDRNEE